jgi:hypothetical protein
VAFGAAFVGVGSVLAIAALSDTTVTGETQPTVATVPTSPTSAPGPTTGAPAPDLVPLAVPDFETYCQAAYGAGAVTTVAAATLGGIECVVADGGQAIGVDADAACRQQIGETSEALAVVDAPDGWRCLPPLPRRTALGVAEPQAACDGAGAERGVAALVATDAHGWRCLVLRNGLVGVEWDDTTLDAALDRACRMQFGEGAFVRQELDTPGGWICYGELSA